MFQLEPAETFIITRQLEDPADTNTYYLRAYVRNAKSDTLLDTIDLTDKGSQRFRGNWDVPQDGSGLGFYVTILVKVFTDSGYTTESPLYARTEQQYLIQQRWNTALGGGGGVDINYKKVRRIIQEELEKLPQPIRPKDIDLVPILERIRENYEKISNIKIPSQKEIDLGPIARIVERSNMDVMKEIKGIYIPPIDLSVVVKLLDELKEKNNLSKEEITQLREAFGKAIVAVNEGIEKINKKIKIAPLVGIVQEEKEKVKKKRSFKL